MDNWIPILAIATSSATAEVTPVGRAVPEGRVFTPRIIAPPLQKETGSNQTTCFERNIYFTGPKKIK